MKQPAQVSSDSSTESRSVWAVLDERIHGVEGAVVGASLLMSTLIIFANVVGRYLFSSSLIWAEELARYALIWMTFVGMSLCVRYGTHVTMDVLFNRFPPGLRLLVWRLINLVTASFSLYLAYLGWKLTMGIYLSGQVSPAVKIPMWFVYLAVPVGGLLATRNFIQQAFRDPPIIRY